MFIGWIVMLFVTMAIVASCKTQYVPIETVRTEYRYRDSIRIDSIYERDSIYVEAKSDTVTKYVEHTRYICKSTTLTDTVARIDSIPYPVTVEKIVEVEREMKWHETVLMNIGIVAAICAAIYGLFRFIKKKLVQ